MIAKSLRITGRVQGVFFRASAKQKADTLGITGRVRNCKRNRDTVKAFVEGKDEAVQSFIEWCHEGPPSAEVDHVEVSDATAKNTTSFEITD